MRLWRTKRDVSLSCNYVQNNIGAIKQLSILYNMFSIRALVDIISCNSPPNQGDKFKPALYNDEMITRCSTNYISRLESLSLNLLLLL